MISYSIKTTFKICSKQAQEIQLIMHLTSSKNSKIKQLPGLEYYYISLTHPRELTSIPAGRARAECVPKDYVQNSCDERDVRRDSGDMSSPPSRAKPSTENNDEGAHCSGDLY
jgi:hypothetical protein